MRTPGVAAAVAVCGLLYTAGTAIAADPYRPAPVTVVPAYSWTGAYLGLEGGYSWGRSESAYDSPPFNLATIDPMNPAGWFGGVEGGVNFQMNGGVVLGLEADISAADITDTIPDVIGGPGESITSKTDWVGTVRGRLGMAYGRTLFYGTGGIAFAHTTVSATDGPLSDDATLSGWTIGVGVEQAVTAMVSVKVEYLHSQFGDHTWFAGDPWSSTGHSSSNSVRAGINLHF